MVKTYIGLERTRPAINSRSVDLVFLFIEIVNDIHIKLTFQENLVDVESTSVKFPSINSYFVVLCGQVKKSFVTKHKIINRDYVFSKA